MKITKENYKEIVNIMFEIDTVLSEEDKPVYYYHHSYLSYLEIEAYAYEKGILLNNTSEGGSIMKVTYKMHIE